MFGVHSQSVLHHSDAAMVAQELACIEALNLEPDYDQPTLEEPDEAEFKYLYTMIEHHRMKADRHKRAAECLSSIYLQLKNWE